MSRLWLALWGAAALCAAGCGARTGLVDDGPAADADVPASDADGAFPCNYGRIGELVELAPNLDAATFAPDLAWGGGRLAAAFTQLDFAGRITARACATGDEADWACNDPLEMGDLGAGTVQLAWDGEAFGACWLESSDAWLARFQRIAPDGQPLWDAPAYLVGPSGPCRDLAWAGDRYLVALASNTDDPENSTAVLTMDTLGSVQDELLVVPPYLGEPAPFALAADGNTAAAAWVDTAGLHVRALAGLDESEIAFNVWPSGGHLRLALRGAEAGLLWAVVGDTSSRLFLSRADLATGGAGDPVEVARETAGGFIGVDLVAVSEGYLIVWNAWTGTGTGLAQRTVVVPTRTRDDLGVEVRTSTELFSGDATETYAPGPPSLAYDGLDAYVGVAVPREGDGQLEVRVQVIACHR